MCVGEFVECAVEVVVYDLDRQVEVLRGRYLKWWTEDEAW